MAAVLAGLGLRGMVWVRINGYLRVKFILALEIGRDLTKVVCIAVAFIWPVTLKYWLLHSF